MQVLDWSGFTENEKAIIRYFNDKIMQLEHRLAFQNKVAAQSYLKPHEMQVFDTKVGA